MSQLRKVFFASLLAVCSQTLAAEEISNQQYKASSHHLFYKSNSEQSLSLKVDEIRTLLLNEQKNIVLALPLPNGQLVDFSLTVSSIMEEGLAKKYPNIKTFSGVSLENPRDTGRFDITPNGFHGMFYHNGERIFVEQKTSDTQLSINSSLSKNKQKFVNDTAHEYISYLAKNSRLPNQLTHHFHQPKKMPSAMLTSASRQARLAKSAQTSPVESALKTYRIAISAAGEYTEFNGGTVDGAMAEIITLVNRLNDVYQRDLAIKLELVENNDLLIFTEASNDPFENNSNDGEVNTGVIDGIIGSENYDIGHILNTDGGGLAILGGVCDPYYKGDGVTGDYSPTNDAFYIDYVAHEIGHQFGAEHTFNGTAGACAGNREADSAYEVGSGSTIMAYAGICDEQNLQHHSDAFFLARSIEQITQFTQYDNGADCGEITGEVNKTAIVDAGLDYTIPAHTPFKLSGKAEDIDSVNLSYSWQQFDLGTASSSLVEQIDDGSRPLFRAFYPSSETERYFPQFSSVLNSTSSVGESLPTTNRSLTFRLMVFDHEGGVSFDETNLTVIDTGEAFSVTSPMLDDIWTQSNNPIRWQVAQTNDTPINCSSLDVLLSKDAGANFDITLASKVINNGSSEISLNSFCADDINTNQARLKLVCNTNVFYAVNDGIFSIDKALSPSDISITGQSTMTVTEGESIDILPSQFTYACESPESISILAGEHYTFVDQTITPNQNFVGKLFVDIVTHKAGIQQENIGISIMVNAKPEPAPEPPKAKSSGSLFWLLLSWFIIPWRIYFVAQKRSFLNDNQ